MGPSLLDIIAAAMSEAQDAGLEFRQQHEAAERRVLAHLPTLPPAAARQIVSSLLHVEVRPS